MEHTLLEPPHCRYCLDEDNEKDMISPCKCTGTTKYVHRACLEAWFEQKNNNVVIPGDFGPDGYRCELCHTKYQFEYVNVATPGNLYLDVAKYILCITTLLFVSYIITGVIFDQFAGEGIFYFKFDSIFLNVLWDGFIIVTLLIDFCYLILLLKYAVYEDEILCCFCMTECEAGEADGEGCVIAGVCLLGLLLTSFVLVLYYDIISRVIHRHHQRSKRIAQIHPYEDV